MEKAKTALIAFLKDVPRNEIRQKLAQLLYETGYDLSERQGNEVGDAIIEIAELL